jgi:hypothetical protein
VRGIWKNSLNIVGLRKRWFKRNKPTCTWARTPCMHGFFFNKKNMQDISIQIYSFKKIKWITYHQLIYFLFNFNNKKRTSMLQPELGNMEKQFHSMQRLNSAQEAISICYSHVSFSCPFAVERVRLYICFIWWKFIS